MKPPVYEGKLVVSILLKFLQMMHYGYNESILKKYTLNYS